MPFFIRFPIYFIMSYAILCIPIADEPLFLHLYEWTTPHVEDFNSSVIKARKFIAQKGKRFKKKLFNEKKTIKKHREDSVKSHYSSTRQIEKKLHNSYSRKERESLHQIFKEHKQNSEKRTDLRLHPK